MEISKSNSNYSSLIESKAAEEQPKTTEQQTETEESSNNEFLQSDIVALSGGHNGDSPKSKEKQD